MPQYPHQTRLTEDSKNTKRAYTPSTISCMHNEKTRLSLLLFVSARTSQWLVNCWTNKRSQVYTIKYDKIFSLPLSLS